MPPCPNCGAPAPAGARLCPNCGQEMPAVGPPPPTRGGGVALGVVLGLLFFLVLDPLVFVGLLAFRSRDITGPVLVSPGIVGVLALGVHWGTRRRHPVFARAFGWTSLGMFAVALGALAACFAVLGGGH